MKSKKKLNKDNFFIREIKESLFFIRDSKKYIYSVIGIFLFFSLIGFFIPAPEPIKEQIIELFNEIILETQDMSGIGLSFFIISNNLWVSFLGIFSGIFFGILPIFIVISNGYIVGFVSSLSVSSAGFSSLLNLVPHGIFELPAFFISLGMGLRLGFWFFISKKQEFKKEILISFKTFILIIIPLLIIAGIIEGFLIYLIR